MRQHLATVVLGLLGGCSWIYNPDNLKKPIDGKDFMDAPVDVEIIADADLSHPELMSVFPTTVYEGVGVTESGTGVGVPALVVLRGHNFAKDPSEHLMVTMTPDTGGMITIDDTEIARDGNFIAVSVTVPIDGTCHDGSSHNVTITVQQDDGVGGTAMTTPLTGLTIACLDEFPATAPAASALKARYSKVDVASIAFAANETVNTQAIIHSMSYVKVTGAITADATAAGPGPGGCAGGTAGASLAAGGPGGCTGGGVGGGSSGGGGGGGFVLAGSPGAGGNGGAGGPMIGDVPISSYVTNVASGGGGGGGDVGGGAAGGPGGGTLEITAHGTINIATVSASGANGATTGNTGAGGGGGGAGGVIVLRAYQDITVGGLTVNKGSAGLGTGLGGSSGGDGSLGRTRIDAANTGVLAVTPGYRGPMFVNPPMSVTTQVPTLALVQGDTIETVNGNVIAGSTVMPFMVTFGTSVPATTMAMPTLTSGYNQVCIIVPGGDPHNDVAENCIEIAFLPGGD